VLELHLEQRLDAPVVSLLLAKVDRFFEGALERRIELECAFDLKLAAPRLPDAPVPEPPAPKPAVAQSSAPKAAPPPPPAAAPAPPAPPAAARRIELELEVDEFRGTGTFETIVLEGDTILQTEEQVDEEEVDIELADVSRRIEAARDAGHLAPIDNVPIEIEVEEEEQEPEEAEEPAEEEEAEVPEDDPDAPFEKVKKTNPAAAELLRLCAFLHSDAIPVKIIMEGAAELGPLLGPVASDRLKLDEAIRKLLNYSLVYRSADGKMLSLPFNSSTPVLYFNKDAFKKAGLDANKPPKTWKEFSAAAEKLKASGQQCVYTTGWPAWMHIENFSAWHNVPIGTRDNGMSGTDTQFTINSPLHVRHLTMLGDLAKRGEFTYAGRQNQAEANRSQGEGSDVQRADVEEHAGKEMGQRECSSQPTRDANQCQPQTLS